MAQMGSYCKAYLAKRFRDFPGWSEDLSALRPGDEGERAGLDDDDVLYLQESLAVTDGIFIDENVVFAGQGPEWESFCRGALDFAPPALVEA